MTEPDAESTEITVQGGTDRTAIDPTDVYVNVRCPHCGREEKFDDEFTARAWLTGHIQEEHGDELPDYRGVGNDE